VYTLQEVLTKTAAIIDTEDDVPALFVTDASSTHAFVYLADGSFLYVADFLFSSDEASASSSYRELLALHKALSSDEQVFRQFSTNLVYWQTDNQACVRFIQFGSRRPHIQRIILSIKTKERDLKIRIIPVWTPRSHARIVAADAGSRFATSTDEWFIDRSSLGVIFRLLSFQPDENCVDCFASAANTVCTTFYSAIPQVGAAGVDFFAHTPSQPNLYMCPPISLAARAFGRLAHLPGKRCLLIVPRWPSANFWPVLFPGGSPHKLVQKCHEFRPQCYSPVPCIFTSTKFTFLALLIVT